MILPTPSLIARASPSRVASLPRSRLLSAPPRPLVPLVVRCQGLGEKGLKKVAEKKRRAAKAKAGAPKAKTSAVKTAKAKAANTKEKDSKEKDSKAPTPRKKYAPPAMDEQLARETEERALHKATPFFADTDAMALAAAALPDANPYAKPLDPTPNPNGIARPRIVATPTPPAPEEIFVPLCAPDGPNSVANAARAPLVADGKLPDSIVSDEEGTWAHDTVNRRLREDILSRVVSDNKDALKKSRVATTALKALEAELSIAADAQIRPVRDDGGADVERWNKSILAPHLGTTLLCAPWLVVEFYFYRRVLEAFGYFGDGPLALHDPFSADKNAGLAACADATAALAPRLNAFAKSAATKDLDQRVSSLKLFALVSLWGNRMDLSIWPEGGGGDAGGRSSDALNEAMSGLGEEKLLHDDAGEAAAFLLRRDVANVGIVVDNAGFELVCDLALADAILCARRGTAATATGDDGDGSGPGDGSDPPATFEDARVTFHVKGHPTFVSDAMDKDVRGTVYVMQQSENAEIAAMGRRWATHLSTGAWVIAPNNAWAQPQPLWDLPSDVFDALRAEDVVVLKGDANYRRLLGDRRWDFSSRFSDVAAYFPTSLLALRTLKAEIACGIAAEQVERAKRENPHGWLVSGAYGVAQFLEKPAGHLEVASVAWHWGAEMDAAGVRLDCVDTERLELARVLAALAGACVEISKTLRRAPPPDPDASSSEGQGADGAAAPTNATGDKVKKLDVLANALVRDALHATGCVRYYASEEEKVVVELDSGGAFVVACDPLDGSRNLDASLPTGTIFGVHRVLKDAAENEEHLIHDDVEAHALQRGSALVAAGYASYSSATNLVVAVAGGGPATEFTLSETDAQFKRVGILSCPPRGQTYSLNDARFADWPQGLQKYVAKVREGKGETKKKYSGLYVGSLVTDFHRTLKHGGWCGNPRPHLRTVYEANPLAFIARACGGAASDGSGATLNKTVSGVHDRAPLFIGSREDVEEVTSYAAYGVTQAATEYEV